MAKYDHERIARLREQGESWEELARQFGAPSRNVLRSTHYRWLEKRNNPAPKKNTGPTPSAGDPPKAPPGDGTMVEGTLTGAQLERIETVDDLLDVFGVDRSEWEVQQFWVRGGSWDQSVEKGTVAHSFRVSAHIVRRVEAKIALLEDVFARLAADAAEHAPAYEPVPRQRMLSDEGDPVLFELAVHDPHIGMLAWGDEVGKSYDSKIAVRDYQAAVEYLLGFAQHYPTEEILYVVGHDFLHVDGYAQGAKGGTRGGATAAGTAQDIDSRLAKMFTTARQAAVAGIDAARLVSPVTVVVVPGNHDQQQMYRMGEVLAAWYRNDPEVTIQYGPNRRRWFRYGKNGFLLTHGEEYKRQRDNLPMIFATEAPRDILTNADHWEVHTGHHHIAMGGRYMPTSELTESRSIRVRSLPGITPEDSWHHEEGYKHKRAATALIWRRSGGMAGHHEFTL